MSRINRREFRTLSDHNGRLNINRMPPRLMRSLESHGVSRAELSRIAGDDHVISGPEFNALFDALTARAERGGSGNDRGVSEDLFSSLASRIERDGATERTSDSTRSTVGIGGRVSARPGTVETDDGTANLDEAADLEGRTDGQQACWFVAMLQCIAEFFVETIGGGDYIRTAERDEALGRELGRNHGESLRAILDEPGGEDAIRAQLQSQRPEGTSENDWNQTVNQVMRGIRAEIASGPDLPDDVAPSADLLVRDRAAVLYAANDDAAARAELGATVEALAQSGLSTETQLALLNQWESAGRPAEFRQQLEGVTQALAGRSEAVQTAAREQLDAHPERFGRLSGLIRSTGFGSDRISDDARIAALRTTGTDTAEAVANLDRLVAADGFERVSPEVQTRYVNMMLDESVDAREKTRSLQLLDGAQTGDMAGINNVLFGDATLQAGSQGDEVRLVQRYLRGLGYDGVLGMTEGNTFDAGTTRAVEAFQRRAGLLDGNPPAATAGVVNQATMRAMVHALHARGMDANAFRFTTDLSLNRPTRATDGPWRATQRWTPALQQEFEQFADAYVKARIPRHPNGQARLPEWGERVDCADLSYEALIQFARQRGLPISLSNGQTTFTHRSRGPIVGRVQSAMGAMHLRQNTRPLGEGELPRPGDLGNMDWDQSVGDGHDSRYWHSHNIVDFDPLFHEATVVYGSLDDLVKESALQRFNGTDYNLTIHDIREREIIDAINDDSGQNRQQPRAEQERRVRELLEGHRTDASRPVSDADVNRFITMVSNDANLHRNAPTAVSTRDDAFTSLVEGGRTWADPTARAAAVADLNQRFGARFTEADIDRLVTVSNSRPPRGMTRRQAVTQEAARLVAARVPEGRREGAADALLASTRGAVRYHAVRDAVSDPGLRNTARADFNRTFGARVTDRDMVSILRAGDGSARRVAEGIVARRGVPAERQAEAAQALLDAVDGSRRFRRWDFDAFNAARGH
ncbi:MAG: peptidoglycan-binding domain-containing protein [Deltaproteobacteria bacterium]